MLRRMVLLRHGETEYNATGRLQGHIDSVLTETGREQARAAVPALMRFCPELAVTSDLRRAAETAEVFSEISGVPLRSDKRLRETHVGAWQGLTGDEVDERWPGGLQAWREPTWSPPGWEARVEVAARTCELIGELDAELAGTALLCAHGGTIGATTARLLGLPLRHWPVFAGMGNCHWTVLARSRGQAARWRLVTYNAAVTG
jgi:broad specificity phosphatase PhoE